jgi:excisionase family DNA binding protein
MNDEVLTTSDVGLMFGVDPKTITRWANEGRLPYFKTLGGHRRFHRSAVEALIAESQR